MIALHKKGNTQVFADDVISELKGADIIVKLYSTEVVRFNACEIILNAGGWKTVTTKQRMNQASSEFGLGFTVFQRQGQWFVSYAGNEAIPFFENSITLKRS